MSKIINNKSEFKFNYFTTKRYPSLAADDIYALNLAMSLSKVVPNFKFYVNKFSKDKPSFIKVHYGYSKFRLAYSYLLVLTLLVFQKYNIFMTNDLFLLKMFCYYKKFFNFKLVIDWHMSYGETNDSLFLKNSDLNITTSQKLRSRLLSLNKNTNIKTILGGVNLDYFTNCNLTRKGLNFPENKKILAYIGSFKSVGQEKGLKTLIDSLKFLSPEYICLLAGGKEEDVLEYSDYVKRNNLQNRIIIMGRVKHEEISSLMKLSDFLIIPYPDKPHFRDFGFPMKVYEYMAAGKPIIYSKLDLVEEVLMDCGVSFEADNAKDLADSIIKTDLDTNLKTVNVEKAKNKVLKMSWDNKALQIYDTIIQT